MWLFPLHRIIVIIIVIGPFPEARTATRLTHLTVMLPHPGLDPRENEEYLHCRPRMTIILSLGFYVSASIGNDTSCTSTGSESRGGWRRLPALKVQRSLALRLDRI